MRIFSYICYTTNQIFNEKQFTMNTKKLLYGIMAFLVLVAAAACSSDSADESVYEQGVDKSKVTTSPQSVDKSKVTSSPRTQSVDKSKVTSKPKNN